MLPTNKSVADCHSTPKTDGKITPTDVPPTASEGVGIVPEIVIGSPKRSKQAWAKHHILGDLSSIGSERNPRAAQPSVRGWFGRRSLASTSIGGEGSPTYRESKKENYLPQQAEVHITPMKPSKVKSRSLGNLTGWLHRSPKALSDGLFSRGIKKEKIASPTLSLLTSLNSTPLGQASLSPTLPPLTSPRPISLGLSINSSIRAEHTDKGEFSNEEVGKLIKRLSAQFPQTPDNANGSNPLGGRHHTSTFDNIPTSTSNLDKSPSARNESNPIAVCMDLINAASKEPQSLRRERLLQLSSILVDAVSKSRDAECAAEEAKMAAVRAECAFLETRKNLQEMTELMKRGKGVFLGDNFI
jgi:hypothetical protein